MVQNENFENVSLEISMTCRRTRTWKFIQLIWHVEKLVQNEEFWKS